MMHSNNSKNFNLIAVLFTVMLFVVSWKLILPGYSANKAQIKILDQQIDQASAKKDALDKARSEFDSVDSAYKAITVSVSEDADEPNLISELEAIASKNGITIPSISISDSDTVSADNEETFDTGTTSAGHAVSFSLAVTGTFDQLNAFMTSLEKSVKFMNIQSATFSKGEDDQLGLSLNISAFSRVQTASSEDNTQS